MATSSADSQFNIKGFIKSYFDAVNKVIPVFFSNCNYHISISGLGFHHLSPLIYVKYPGKINLFLAVSIVYFLDIF